jgi:sulfatase maturation enzyme AslB (radical SAM superfamily)
LPAAGDVRALHLVLTTACNLRCAYCYQDRKACRFMSPDTLRRALDRLLGSDEDEILLSLYGGEPLLAFPLVRQAVDYAATARSLGRRIRIELATNGTLLDDGRVGYLERHGVHTHVSFDGLPAAQERRGPGTFELLDKRLRELRRSRPVFFEECLEVAVTLTGANLAWLADSVEYFLELGVPRIVIAPLVTHDPDWGPGSARELARQFSRLCRSARRHLRWTGRMPLAVFERSDGRPRQGSDEMCGVGSARSLTVDGDGRLHGCALFVTSYQTLGEPALREWIGPLAIGHIDDPDLDARIEAYRARVRSTEAFRNRRHKYSRLGRCRSCPFLEDCNVCPVSIAHVPGNTDPRRIPELQCAFNREAARHARHVRAPPTDLDRVTGRAPVPGVVRKLLATVGR